MYSCRFNHSSWISNSETKSNRRISFCQSQFRNVIKYFVTDRWRQLCTYWICSFWGFAHSWGLVVIRFKTSLTFKCLIEHLLADFSYSRPLDTYLWKQMMKMNRNITYKWCNIAKKHLLFTKRKCHKFSWLFTASRYSPRRRSIDLRMQNSV